ncbi:MAG: hypothetical protein R2744_03000 [Bacteroidales bacterium]
MKKSDSESRRDDFIADWIKDSGDIKAPEGFTHNVMTRVYLEPATGRSRSKNPFGLPFWIGSAMMFAVLLALSLFSPQSETGSWIGAQIDKFPDPGKLGLSLEPPDFSFLNGYDFLVYIVIASAMLVLLDAIFIRRVILRKK